MEKILLALTKNFIHFGGVPVFVCAYATSAFSMQQTPMMHMQKVENCVIHVDVFVIGKFAVIVHITAITINNAVTEIPVLELISGIQRPITVIT